MPARVAGSLSAAFFPLLRRAAFSTPWTFLILFIRRWMCFRRVLHQLPSQPPGNAIKIAHIGIHSIRPTTIPSARSSASRAVSQFAPSTAFSRLAALTASFAT